MFNEIDVSELNMNPFTKIGSEWALLAAGTKEKGYNMIIYIGEIEKYCRSNLH